MAMNRPERKYWGKGKNDKVAKFVTSLKIGDKVMVIVGGNPKKRKELKGQVGKILKFIPKRGRVIVEGLNMVTRHQRAKSAQEPAGKVLKEGSIEISNVMYYAEAIKKPVRLSSITLDSGKRVRAYKNPETKKLVAIES
jgi:large subunit ribosomal protein L24